MKVARGGEESIEHAISTVLNRWESNVTSGVLHVRLSRAHVRKTAAARAAAVLPVVYAAYTVHFRRYTRLSSRVSHVTFPTVVTVSIVRGSILFVLYELLVILYPITDTPVEHKMPEVSLKANTYRKFTRTCTV